MTLPDTRKQALEMGVVAYFTGTPCKNNHIDKRYSNTGVCYQCKRDNAKIDYSNNKSRIINTNNRSRHKNKNKHNERSKKWVKDNPEKRKEVTAKYREKNRDKLNEYNRNYQKIKRQDPNWRLSTNLSKAIWESLKENGKSKLGKSYKSLVSWDLPTLRAHLESKFYARMTWNNYGPYWHLDHIKPLSKFEPENIMKAWELDNLQPLLAQDNLSKNNKYDDN